MTSHECSRRFGPTVAHRGATHPARETHRMRSGQSPTRPLRRGMLALALAGLALVAGCSRDHYSEQLAYPVRTDYVVIPGTWEITPSGFNRPGVLPVDAINLPDKE